MLEVAKTGVDNVYEGFNLLVRRKAKENNFKAVLETIRNILNVSYVGKAVPEWLHDVFLGYGDPAAANYKNLDNNVSTFDFKVLSFLSLSLSLYIYISSLVLTCIFFELYHG